MKYPDMRNELIHYGIKILESGLIKGTGGNLSSFIREENLMLITPSGIEYNKIEPEDIVLMDLKGNIIEGRCKPSSEHRMHSILYENREDIDAVVHTHSRFATTLSSMKMELPAIHYLVAMSGGKNVRCADYATYGTENLAKNALIAMKDRFVCFLANHGMLAGAKNLSRAVNICEDIEFCSEVYLRALSCGNPVILSDKDIDDTLKNFTTYGQKTVNRNGGTL